MCTQELTAYQNPDGGRPIFGWAGVKAGLPEIKLPCGKCAECQHNYYSMWATRGFYELLNWRDNFFVTLTYDEKNLPKDQSLHKEHVQKFLKRLKKAKNSSKENPVRQIYCGEYGEKNHRPHYHIILFNCPLNDLKETRMTDQGHLCYESKEISNLWEKGLCEISEATPATVAYLFKYILKKKSRKEKKKPLTITHNSGLTWDVAHEFIEPSRNPGIGAHLRNSPSIRKGFLSLDGSIKPLPKYFLEYIKKTDPRWYEELKDQRFEYAKSLPVKSQEEKNRINSVQKSLQKLKKRD